VLELEVGELVDCDVAVVAGAVGVAAEAWAALDVLVAEDGVVLLIVVGVAVA
jgi:hypothetical protein